MFETILIVIGSACFAWIFQNQITPLEDLKNLMGLGNNRTLRSKDKVIDYIIELLNHFLTCICISFWITWIVTGSFLYGCISYVLASILARYMNKIEF